MKNLINQINEALNLKISAQDEDRTYKLLVPYHTRRAQKGAVIICSGDGKDPLDLPKNKLVALVKGVIWRDERFRGKSFIEIARENNCSRAFVLQSIQKSLEIV